MSSTPEHQLWIVPAQSEEQGSFCDLISEAHYQNVSQADAEAIQESAMRSGHTIVPTEEYPSEYDDDQRFNLARQSVDSVGSSYPSKYGPERP